MNVLLGISGLLLVLAAFGLAVDAVQLFITWRYFRAPPRPPGHPRLGISILKPLCGADDDLAANLRQFATLPYPNYELILGVKNASDPAYPFAVEAVKRWPARVRLVLQRGEPGLNPKVNQLCTLVEEATKEIVLVSDSNVRAPDGYLEEIAATFEADPQVACVSNPIVGLDEERLGSALDNFYLATTVATGVVSAKWAGKDIVVGKSMALRREELERMGGFYGARNHLAEDYVLGLKAVEMGKKVHVCRRPVYQVSQKKGFKDFLDRHRRWAVIHRTAISPLTYVGQAVMNPVPLTLLALLLAPSRLTLLAFAGTWALKSLIDTAAIRFHRPAFGLRTPLYVLLKDLGIFAAWCNAIFRRTVVWRGNRLRVERGTLLRPPEPAQVVPAELAPSAASSPAPVRAPVSWAKTSRDGDRTAA